VKNLAGSLRAVEHQLTHGEASEGDVRDIAWCARQVAEVATALEAARDVLKLRDALESAVSPADAVPKKPNG
jgi:hypothetical protein